MSPHLRGRIDIDKFNKGLQQHENFIPSIQGPTRYREGFEWMREEVSGNVKLIDFSINNENRYLLALSAGRINIYGRDGTLLYQRVNGEDDGFGNTVSIPYLDDQINDVRWSPEVETMIFTHPLHPPYSLTANSVFDTVQLFSTETVDIDPEDGAPDSLPLYGAAEDPANPADTGTPLYAGASGAEGLTPWKWEQIEFTSHPFQKIDTSDAVVRIEDEEEVIKLVSNGSEFGDAVYAEAAAGGLTSNEVYIEYKVGNQYGLGRALSTTTTPAAPADPTSSVCFVEPVDKVVNIDDPSVRIGLFDNNGGVDTENATWLTRDGVPAGKTHVRADSLIFRTSNIGAWVRVGGSKLFTNVVSNSAGTVGGNNEFTGQDGDIRWCHITDYRGVEDHPVEFIEGTFAAEEFESGSIYEIYDWGSGGIKGLISFDGTGTDRNNDLAAAVRKTGGTNRFAMNHDLYTYTSLTDDTEAWDGEAKGTVSAGTIIANMSTQRQFDVVEVDTVYEENATGYPKLIVPSSTVSAYDLVTDATGQAFHTATLRSNMILFDESRDLNRFFLGALVDKWVLCRINGNSTFPYTAEVDVLGSIPRDDITGEFLNDGVFTKFRWGAWYENNYPNCVSFYEQRRVFAGTRKDPNLVWLSNLNDPTDFRTSEDDGQVLDTTGITYQLGTQSTIIRWLAAGPTLIAGTESNEWQLRPNEFSAAITPSNIRITQETSIGSKIQGIRVGASVFFPHISGKQLHEFKFDFQTQQFVVSTVTKLVPDLFEEDEIKSMAYQFQPNSVFWIVTENGNLYSLTYRKEDDFYAWAKHSSPTGTFKDVAVLSKGDENTSEDQLWLIVERDGENHLERMAVQFSDDLTDDLISEGRFLDSYVYKEVSDSPTTTVSIPDRVIQDGNTTLVVDGVVYSLTGVSPGSVPLVSNTPDAIVIEGAGSSEVNKVQIRADNDIFGYPSYVYVEGGQKLWQTSWSFINSEWLISNTEGSVDIYYKAGPADHPTEAVWSAFLNGEEPVPTIRYATWEEVDAAGIDRSEVRLRENGVANHYTLVGIPYPGKLQLNPQAFDNGSGKNAYGQIKRFVSIRPYLYKSKGYKIGFDEDNLETIPAKGGTSLYTGFTDEHNIIASQFEVDKTPIIVQDQPLPLTLVSAVIKTEL
jgi:hypothetical protein